MTTSRVLDAEIVRRLHEHRPDVFTPERNAELWEEIPEGLRLVHFTRQSIPDEYRIGFGYYHDKIGNAHLDTLPEEMAREIAYVFWRTIEIGGRVAISPWGLCVRELGRTAERLRSEGRPWRSLMDRTPDEWEHELQRTWALRTGGIGNPNTLRTITAVLNRACKLLWFAYDDGPWWTREIWNLRLDPRIPRRTHEPAMEETIHWHRIEPGWLGLAGMWHMKAMLETNQLTWTSVIGRCSGLLLFSDFLTARHITEPELMTDHQRVRPLMLDFLDELRTKPIERGTGRRIGELRSDSSTAGTISAVRQLYRYLHDHREDAAQVLGEPRWARLGPEHLRFLRDGDLPRRRARRTFDERHLISEADQARVSAIAHMIGEPTDANGLGDPQAMRILLLLIATGRRRSEIRMLDYDPIIPVAAQPSDDGEVVAKLRYQQTKIEGLRTRSSSELTSPRSSPSSSGGSPNTWRRSAAPAWCLAIYSSARRTTATAGTPSTMGCSRASSVVSSSGSTFVTTTAIPFRSARRTAGGTRRPRASSTLECHCTSYSATWATRRPR
jgi:hypothetical protein